MLWKHQSVMAMAALTPQRATLQIYSTVSRKSNETIKEWHFTTSELGLKLTYEILFVYISFVSTIHLRNSLAL
jgi:hypothetical protein